MLQRNREELVGRIDDLQKELVALKEDIATASEVASHSDQLCNKADSEN